MQRKIAVKTDWKTLEMPEANECFKLERKISGEELNNLRYGHIPHEMEDKWFSYMDGNTLYAHRSWTGYCIYIIEINEGTGIHDVTVNRDTEQYRCNSINEDIKTVNDLLDWWSEPKRGRGLVGSDIHVRQCDITTLGCDAIVNAANKSLLGGGGVDGAIHRAAGPELLKECRTLNGCETGEAKITKGYRLPARYVIHTVGPIYSGNESDAILLAACYRNSLDLAKKNNLHSIAFPAISTGVYGYPLADATRVAVTTVQDWISRNNDYSMDITFCCFDQRTSDIYNRGLKRMRL